MDRWMDGQMMDKMSEKLTWAFSSGELKTDFQSLIEMGLN
jgi:hypothetical protein